VLIESAVDLTVVKESIAELASANQGKLLFLIGKTGVGKTTLAAACGLYLARYVTKVVTPPPDYELPLGELVVWLGKNVSPDDREQGIVVVNLDGRELPAVDPQARQAAMVNLNAYLRRTNNVLALWPVINRSFADEMIEILTQVGGSSALSRRQTYDVSGIPSTQYYDALSLILSVTATRLEDAAITRDEVENLCSKATSIGDYLRLVHDLVVSRYDLGEIGTHLPRINIVVSSNGDSSEACRMLRRGSKYLADPERLLQFSRANVADDWRKYGKRNAKHGLPFVTSLFEVRLLNLTGSMVVNACAFSPDRELFRAVRRHYPNPVKSNAANTMKKSSLIRSLMDQEDVGPSGASSRAQVSQAYNEVQKLSKEKHRVINEAIVDVITGQLDIALPELCFEYEPHGHEHLRVDCWFQRGDRPETLEFTHRKVEELSPATISSYTLGKLMDYARDYGLI
jgi:energy-coupling factor transporter ATP-binding protein EcfA2